MRDIDGIDLAQYTFRWRALGNAAITLGVPPNTRNFVTSFESVSFSRKTLLLRVSKKVSNLVSN